MHPQLRNPHSEKEYWVFNPNEMYDGMSDFFVSVPEGVACMLINRSSFNRAGVHLNSGLYDSSFQGNIGFTLFNRSQHIVYTQPNTRIGQIIFVHSESVGEYSGGYNTQNGQHWADKGE